MRALIIGGGLAGLTSAYMLARAGIEVDLVERGPGPALETSYANGGLLTPSMSEPWNAPDSWRVLLTSLGRSDAALQLRLRALPWVARWGIDFLRHSRPAAYRRNTIANLRLALRSLHVLREIEAATGIGFDHRRAGTLRVFRDKGALDAAVVHADALASEGLVFRRLDVSDTIALEPSLAPIADALSGGVFAENDESGDAYLYCSRLADHLRVMGVGLHFNTPVSEIVARQRRVTEVRCGDRVFTADHHVVCAGSYSGILVHKLGLHLPIQAAKGYSLTFAGAGHVLRKPIIDDTLHAVVVPLGGALRIAGTAEFDRFDRSLPPARIANLFGLLYTLLPEAELDRGSAMPWCGLRAMTSDGVPLIGRTSFDNLWLNTGHGHLGWTLAAGSAELLAAQIGGAKLHVDPSTYGLGRFG